MCPDSLNWTLWVRFRGRYWYQSFIDGSNIWSVDRIDPWGPEMDHPPLGRSYLVVESSCYMAMLIVTWEISSSAAAKYELYILLPADQRCSKNCVAALQADTFVYLYIYIYIYIYIYNIYNIYNIRSGPILSLRRPANKKRCYFVTTSLIGWAKPRISLLDGALHPFTSESISWDGSKLWVLYLTSVDAVIWFTGQR